jgi:uncharacterized Fe-S cluster protein YjdI
MNMDRKIVKEYTNGEITVTWKPDECIHSTVCFKKLPKVFKPNERPWVKINEESTALIIETVDACPTDALTWRYNNENADENKTIIQETIKIKPEIKLRENGPLIVPAEINLVDENGKILKVNETKYICRCGHSKNKPFCDGSHILSGFKG